MNAGCVGSCVTKARAISGRGSATPPRARWLVFTARIDGEEALEVRLVGNGPVTATTARLPTDHQLPHDGANRSDSVVGQGRRHRQLWQPCRQCGGGVIVKVRRNSPSSSPSHRSCENRAGLFHSKPFAPNQHSGFCCTFCANTPIIRRYLGIANVRVLGMSAFHLRQRQLLSFSAADQIDGSGPRGR